MDPEATVALAYRAVLRREADPDGLATYVAALRAGRSMAWLVDVLASSEESQALDLRLAAPALPTAPPPQPEHWHLDGAPPMRVDAHCSPEELQALWDRVAHAWSQLGEEEPHWSVLTEDRFRRDALDDAALRKFHETGEGEVTRLEAWLRRAGLEYGPDTACAEYGCGVGRITRALARRFGRVAAFDVSPSHLRTAQAQLDAEGIRNVELARVWGAADLDRLAGFDVFYSVIALQHSPPPIILDVLGHAFAGLRPGGCAFFQVPTYAQGYEYSAAADLAVPRPEAEMEMHFVPQRAVLDLAHRTGLAVMEVQPDWCVGRPGEWISNTFLLQRP